MKVAFAILADNHLHNEARKISLAIDNKYHTGLLGAMLPPHVTLKQPFVVKDMEHLKEVESYFDSFAQKVKSFTLKFNGISLFETGVIFIDVDQDDRLMNLHLEMLKDLKNNFNTDPGTIEGKDNYHFHCTLAVWGKDLETYKNIYEEYKDLKIDYEFNFDTLGMFVYTDDDFGLGTFFNYKSIKI